MHLQSILRSTVNFLAVQSGNKALSKAQFRALSRQLPMMYFILLSSTWAVAATHMAFAPIWLTICVPLLLSAVSLVRVVHWWNTRNMEPDGDAALKALQRTNRLAPWIAVAFTGWSLALYPYGDAYTKSHIAFYMSITVLSCIFCLMHLRSAALIVTAIVNASVIIFFMATGQPTFIAMSINFAFVSVGMLAILMINYRNFVQMVEAQQQTEALSIENLRMANLDSLTGLENRRAFFAHLQTGISKAEMAGTRLCLGTIDLDGFKPVNDVYGHVTGDKILVEASNRLAALGKQNNTQFFRLGGDEFAFVMSGAKDNDAILRFAESVTAALKAPIVLPEAPVFISCSTGIAIYPDTALSPEELFERADYALYHGKRSERGSCTLFTTALDAQIHRQGRIEQALKQVDLETELSVLFQPIVNVATSKPIGFEALARWTSPTLGHISPGEFIQIAERAGTIGRLTRALLQKALTAATQWPDEMRLSFNLSAHDLNTAESIRSVLDIIEKSGFAPHRLDIEITETAFGHDFEQVRKSIELLRKLGCGISLDDFGTGYSSLTRLHALPLTKIKIDRSFVTDITKGSASYKIVKSLLALSRDMYLDCIVEGVETAAELGVLQKLGVQLVQGYYYSQPVPESQIAHYFKERTAIGRLSTEA
jgi:diguanylate cyclase (GGDEF)-like protein